MASKPLFLVFVFSVLFGSKSIAVTSVNFEGSEGEISLDQGLAIWRSDDSLSFRKEWGKGSFLQQFEPYATPNYQFGYTHQWIWLTFSLKNTSTETLNAYLATQSAILFYYDFFLVDEETSEVIKEVRTGFERPFANRDIPHRFFIFKIPIPAGKTYRVFTRVHNKAGNIIQPLRLFSEYGFEEYRTTNNFLISGIFALWFLATVIALLLWINFKEKIYMYYFGYIFCLMMFRLSYEGLSNQYFWPKDAYLVDISRMFYIPAIVCIWAFVYRILWSNSNRLKWIYTASLYVIYGLLVDAFICVIPIEIFPQRNPFVIVLNVFVLCLIILMFTAVGVKLKERYKPAYMIAFAMSPLLIYGAILISNVWGLFTMDKNGIFIQYGFSICALLEMVALFWMLLFRFKNIQRLQNLSAERMRLYGKLAQKNTNDLSSSNESYQNSKYDKEEIEQLFEKLKIYMEGKKPYLEPDLSLNRLADCLECHPNMLSQCINQLEQRNFNEYVNHFRLEEAKRMLAGGKYASYSVEGIGFEAGFSSKSTFYTAFKRLTGVTPTEYRKSLEGSH